MVVRVATLIKLTAHLGLAAGDAVPSGDPEVVGAAVACGVGV